MQRYWSGWDKRYGVRKHPSRSSHASRVMKITGQVVEGSKMGRELGYPTANIAVDDIFAADNGVYAAQVEVGGKRYGAMANLGIKPTFPKSGGRVLELYLFDFSGNLYGCEITAELVRFIRPEQRFASPEALRIQIAKDEKIVKNILKCILM